MSSLRSLLMWFIGAIVVDAVLQTVRPDDLNNLGGFLWICFVVIFAVQAVIALIIMVKQAVHSHA